MSSIDELTKRLLERSKEFTSKKHIEDMVATYSFKPNFLICKRVASYTCNKICKQIDDAFARIYSNHIHSTLENNYPELQHEINGVVGAGAGLLAAAVLSGGFLAFAALAAAGYYLASGRYNWQEKMYDQIEKIVKQYADQRIVEIEQHYFTFLKEHTHSWDYPDYIEPSKPTPVAIPIIEPKPTQKKPIEQPEPNPIRQSKSTPTKPIEQPEPTYVLTSTNVRIPNNLVFKASRKPPIEGLERLKTRENADQISSYIVRDILNFVVEREINNLIHFTHVDNLSSILEHGILSVTQLRKNSLDYRGTDPNRFDNKLNHISLSISLPNHYYFNKIENNNEFCYIVIDASLLYNRRIEPGLYDRIYCQTNAANKAGRTGSCLEDFKAMFADEVVVTLADGTTRTINRQQQRRQINQPTDIQAEILFRTKIPTDYIKAIIFTDHSLFTQHCKKSKICIYVEEGLNQIWQLN